MIRFLTLWIIGLILFSGGISTYAAETQPVPSSNQGGPTTTPASPSGGLNVTPISPGEEVGKTKKMEGDIQQLGEGIAPSLSKYSLIVGVVMIAIGMVFAKRIAQAGLAMLGVAVFIYFILGDMSKTSILLKKIVATIQSYI